MEKDICMSFIIPAYNAEDNLKKCVESIILNNIDDKYDNKIEILIIENGSTDMTMEIAQTIKQQDERVRVYNSPKGVSKARNVGLKVARGDYIVFIDADDQLKKNSINLMFENLNSDFADLWLYGHMAGEDERRITEKNIKEVYVKNNMQDGMKRMTQNPTRYMQVWGKIFRRSIIDKYNISFNEKMKLSEDSDFTLRYISKCEKIIFMPDVIYYYSLNIESTMRTYDESKVDQYIMAMEETAKYVRNDKNIDEASFEKYILMHFNIAMVREVFVKQNSNSLRNKMNKMSEVIHNPVFYQALKHTKIKECKSLRMLPVLLIKIHMKHVAAVIYIIRANLNAKKERLFG